MPELFQDIELPEDIEIFKKHRMKAKIEYGYGALKSFAVRVQ